MVAALQTPSEISKGKDTQISLYNNCKATSNTPIDLDKLFTLISTGNGFKEIIDRLRVTDSVSEIGNLKLQLPAVTISGLFKGSHKATNLLTHSELIQIDIDKPENKDVLKERLKADAFSFAVFDSPTGTGIKVIVKIVANAKTHFQSFTSLQKYYLQNYNIKIDAKCKDVSRLMYLSFDKNIYINYNSEIWINPINEKQCFENMLIWLEKTKGEKFIEGNRNDFIYKLSAACYRIGISENYTLTECLNRFKNETTTEKEIKATVKSGYKSTLNTLPVTQKNGINVTDNKDTEIKEKNFSFIARVENFITSKYELRFNEVSLDVEFREIGTKTPFAVLNENNLLRELLHSSINISKDKLTSLLASDFVKPYNPFKHYFENLGTWNEATEPDYILKLASYVPVKDEERFKRHFKKMLVRCIACALEDTVFNKQAFILVHPEQNSGKSTFCRWLCPPDLDKYIAENISIDKDSLIALTQNFIINLDELTTMSRAEINALKSVFSKDRVKARAPYERKAVSKPRRANFIGSTNNEEFLSDETGSVRFLCFELKDKINFNYNKQNINDVWRQAHTLYKSKFPYQLTIDEIKENEISNRRYQIETPEMQMIKKIYLPAKKGDNDALFLTPTDMVKELSIDNSFVKFTPQAIGKALRHLSFIQDSRYNETTGYTTKGYYLKKIEI